MSQTVAILPGIASGKRTSAKLQRCLRQAGYQISNDAAKADIVIAHSAGCFSIPPASSKQGIMLVDPPYWPDLSPGQRGRRRIRSNLRYRQYGYSLRYWLQRNLWGLYYTVKDFRRTRWIFRYVNEFDLSQVIKGRHIMLVRNEDDDWLVPDLTPLEKANPKLLVKHLPGDHEDLLFNPQTYVDLLPQLPH